jgi:2-keto-4-pentenoate hydratase/2-oxohepta-3-ene-1,7-dioic acid hydratase in catechol pathway
VGDLAPGTQVSITIEGLGSLTNPVVTEAEEI